MESNTPNSGKSPPLNTLPTPNNPSLTPSDIRVVTQTQDSERLLGNHESTPDHQQLLNPLCGTEQTNIALRKEFSIKFRTACKETFHLTAHAWQAAVGSAILEAVELKKNIKMLCVRPTGGGKSLIFNVVATILKGVTICICPLLSLGADQTRKTLDAVDVESPSPITAFHLDELKLKSVFRLVKAKLRDERSRGTAIIIFTSP